MHGIISSSNIPHAAERFNADHCCIIFPLPMKHWNNFVSLFFPDYCAGCGQHLMRLEEGLCLSCLLQLPRTGMHDEHHNYVERIFWGRADVVAATAFLRMPRHGMVHKLIHELKYRDNQQVGRTLGKLFASELARSERMSDFDMIIPVPLHPKKQNQRGYNQCLCIAEGMVKELPAELSQKHLVRNFYNNSQTRKSRFERWRNVDGLFALRKPHELRGKRILLVDDVVTTGATIEACIHALQRASGVKVSVAALAMPVR
jgi:ComF family protein